MALGNNLKGIKKDTLIPSKKEKTTKSKSKKVVKATPSVKAKTTAKSTPKTKAVAKPASQKKKKPIIKKEAAKASVSKAPQIISKPTETANLNEKILLGGKEDSPITVKLIPSRRKTVRKTKMVFEGSLSLLEAEVIKDCLLTTFTNYDIIDIQLMNITHLDIIPVQLLKMFKNSYSEKKVKIDSDVPFDIKIILDRAGFGSFMFKEEAA